MTQGEQSCVLIVDDDQDMQELIKDVLEDDYLIRSSNGEDNVVDLCNELEPAVVLLDINLKAESGLSICADIRAKVSHQPMILFISGLNTLEQRLEAYNQGGDDFLPKPFQVSELKAKVEILEKQIRKQDDLQSNNQFATQTAMNAMTEASQYGGVLRFFNNMYKAKTVEIIAENFFALMGDLSLHTSIQFRVEEVKTFDYTNEPCAPIELQIYENMHQQDRLIAFSKRLMVNGEFASFIVKNMPVDDEVTTGRLRDILATAIEGLDAKVKELLRLNLLKQTAREVASSSERLSQVMSDHEGFIVGAMNHVIGEINASFNVLDLTEEQEEFFTGLAEKIINSVEESFVRIGNEQDVLNCLGLSLKTVLGDHGSNH